jgi:NADPH2 dehydrogenase
MKTNPALNRRTELRLPNGKTLINRVVVPPMASGTADPGGFVTDQTVHHYDRLAKAGAGLVLVEYSYVHRSGKSEANQLGIQTDLHIKGLARLATVIHQAGGIAGIQFSHAGGKTELEYTDGRLMGPSGIAVPVKDRTLSKPSVMSGEEISLWKESFARAASRAARAGFDLIELHAAHGYGLNQWLSPITNQRSDAYGGELANRARLLLELVASIKTAEPGLLISVRIPGQDFMEGGLGVAESIQLAKLLESAGVDLINVSSGIGGWRRPIERRGEGYLVAEAEMIQSHVAVPVIGVGGIEKGEYIDQGVSTGMFSLAAVGRAILKDPLAWREENLACGA